MAKNKTSRQWVHDHINDPYVKQAQAQGYRSRAAFKLLQIDERDRLLAPGKVVVDLGSTPGGWSQVASALIGAKGKVLATDILPMEPIKHVDFIQGDFREASVLNDILAQLDSHLADLVISDIAPNISGVSSADQAASIYLLELALDLVRRVLKPQGVFVAKLFQGAGSDAYLKELRTAFEKVTIRKPAASRPRSREVYLVARGFKGQPAS